MACRTEFANGNRYEFCPEIIPPAADRLQAIMRGRFIDELTGLGVTAQLHISSNTEQLAPRIGMNGVAGLVGNPLRRFPGLRNNTQVIDMTVTAQGYQPRRFSRNLGPFNTGIGAPADYPHFFSSINLGDVALHRAPSVIKGRCVQNTGTARLPLAGVNVELTGVWHQFPAAHEDPLLLLESANVLALRQGLYADRRAGADTVRRRNLNPVAGEEKTVLHTTTQDTQHVYLSDRLNLNPGDVLAIEIAHRDLVEYLAIDAVEGSSNPAQPALITLAYPLKKEHRAGVSAVRVIPQVPGASQGLLRDGNQGDCTIFLNDLVDIALPSVEITDGIAVPEYHAFDFYRTTSDAEGFFRLPPITRVAQMQIRASRFDLPQVINNVFSPDYDQYENRLDLVFG